MIHRFEYILGGLVSMICRENKLEVLKVIAHPVRVQILEELGKGVKCVSDLEDFFEIRQSNISQHLSLLRRYDLIDFYIDGRLRCYFLKDPFIPDLLELLRKQYEDDLPAPACCPVTRKGKYPGDRRN
jgi:DNA-binding transcriptional ArsR family regulator